MANELTFFYAFRMKSKKNKNRELFDSRNLKTSTFFQTNSKQLVYSSRANRSACVCIEICIYQIEFVVVANRKQTFVFIIILIWLRGVFLPFHHRDTLWFSWRLLVHMLNRNSFIKTISIDITTVRPTVSLCVFFFEWEKQSGSSPLNNEYCNFCSHTHTHTEAPNRCYGRCNWNESQVNRYIHMLEYSAIP